MTRDGVAIGLHMNAGLVVDLPHLDESGAQSIGLFRTELQFMLALRFPRLSAQEALYRTVLDAAGERPVTFRTLDIGGDKVLPYMKGPEEENPALGWRAIRIGLDKPALLRTQMRAMLRAGAGPRSAHHAADGVERRRIRRARALLERELIFADRCGRTRPRGVAGRRDGRSALAAVAARRDRRRAPISCRSAPTTCMQYLYAADRDNKRVSNRFDTLSAGFLRALEGDRRRRARVMASRSTLCGEIGGRRSRR